MPWSGRISLPIPSPGHTDRGRTLQSIREINFSSIINKHVESTPTAAPTPIASTAAPTASPTAPAPAKPTSSSVPPAAATAASDSVGADLAKDKDVNEMFVKELKHAIVQAGL
jgi:hypothetical protein